MESGFSTRADALLDALERLDCELAATLGSFSGEPLFASHPVFSYMARRYGLDLRSVTWEPGLGPGEAGWVSFDALLAERAARWMLWEAAPTETIRQKLESRGVGVIVFEVASNRPAQGDYLSVMNANLVSIRHAAGQESAFQSSCARPKRPEPR